MTVLRCDRTVGQPTPCLVGARREQESGNVGTLDITLFEADHHLVADFRLELHARSISGKGQRYADPRRSILFLFVLFLFGLPGKLDAHPAEFLRVEIIDDKCQLGLRLADDDVGQCWRNGCLTIELHANHLLALVERGLRRLVSI